MKPAHYIEKVKKSPAYKLLMEEDPDAYLCSLFFLRDFDEGNNETQVDFYSPLKKHIISFKVNKGVEREDSKKMQTITHKKFTPQPLPEKIRMDVDEMKPALTDEMHNRDMTYEIEKVLAFLNVMDGRAVWNCTAFLKGLGLLQAHVEDKSASVLFMEKKSLFDLIKFSGGQMQGMPSMAAPENPLAAAGAGNVTIVNPEDLPPAQTAKEKQPKSAKPAKPVSSPDKPEKKKEAKAK